MTYQEINTLIASLGYQYAYHHFAVNTAMSPQFICFYYEQSDDLYADNTNYQRIDSMIVEFYSAYKDIQAELNIEAVFKQNEMTFTKDELFIEDENMYETIYYIEVITNG